MIYERWPYEEERKFWRWWGRCIEFFEDHVMFMLVGFIFVVLVFELAKLPAFP